MVNQVGGKLLDSNEQAHEIADIISDKKGADITVLDIRPVSPIADYFVIATADNDRQAQAMIEEIEKRMKAQHHLPLSVDGEPGSGWVLMDYGDVLVHIFDPGTRDYYQLEELWNNAPTIVRIQ